MPGHPNRATGYTPLILCQPDPAMAGWPSGPGPGPLLLKEPFCPLKRADGSSFFSLFFTNHQVGLPTGFPMKCMAFMQLIEKICICWVGLGAICNFSKQIQPKSPYYECVLLPPKARQGSPKGTFRTPRPDSRFTSRRLLTKRSNRVNH